MQKYVHSLLTMAVILSVSLLCLTRSAWTQENTRLDEEGNPIRTNRSQKADFVAGEILIKFNKGSLDLLELEKDDLTFDLGGRVVKDDSLRNALQAVEGGQLRKVVTRLKPSQKVSVARSGKQVAIPDLYNLMVLKVPLSVDIQELAESSRLLKALLMQNPIIFFNRIAIRQMIRCTSKVSKRALNSPTISTSTPRPPGTLPPAVTMSESASSTRVSITTMKTWATGSGAVMATKCGTAGITRITTLIRWTKLSKGGMAPKWPVLSRPCATTGKGLPA